jgi:recombination protein RecT
MNIFETMLPAPYRAMGSRFLARAKLYISRRPELQECSVPSLVQCVLSAAEYGHSLDGRMAHAVKFNVKKKDANGKEHWVSEAVYMPDYKGLLDMARRHNCIKDGYAEHVHENDVFEYEIDNGKYHHRWKPDLRDRGTYIGTFCLLVFHDGNYKVEYMTEAEVESVRQRSKAKDSGPWVTDRGQMAKKTVIKRALKLYIADPEISELLDRDDRASGFTHEEITTERPAIVMPRATHDLNDPALLQSVAHDNGHDDASQAVDESADQYNQDTGET